MKTKRSASCRDVQKLAERLHQLSNKWYVTKRLAKEKAFTQLDPVRQDGYRFVAQRLIEEGLS